jgi:cyclohexanone monooxygenase
MPDSPAAAQDFNPDALRARYRAERDRRLREDGNEQYQEVAGEFQRYAQDPYVAPGFSRAPVHDEVQVLIVGGGFGGLLAGAKLREAGVQSLRLVEAAGDVGGTWYWNRYPGAACDIEAYVYLPLLEELGHMPPRRFADAPEILAHSQRIAHHYDLYRDALFQTRITRMAWDEAAQRWQVDTDRGDSLRAQFVVMANGPLNRPKLPGIAGVGSFRGHTFHTSRWDYAYTGGNARGGLSGLADKRVGIIGTGATAVQCVPHLAEGAQQLYVFQRTPSSIDFRNDRPTDPAWVKSLQPGWQWERIVNFGTLVSGGYAPVDLVMDGWTETIRNLFLLGQHDRSALDTPEKIAAAMEQADFHKMNAIRARVDAVVQDPATAEALKPWYRQFCKRPCFHDEYLATFNRPNVRLVDTQGRGVERITERAVVVDGREYEVDCLVFATGFEVGTGYARRAGYDLVGRGGQTLSARWQAGMHSLHGMLVRGFPNAFILGTAQAGFTANFPHALAEQARHVAHLVSTAAERGIASFEPTPEAEAAWVEEIIAAARINEAFLAECTPGYYNNEGQPRAASRQNASYGKGPIAYFQRLQAWREAGDLAGLALRSAGQAAPAA